MKPRCAGSVNLSNLKLDFVSPTVLSHIYYIYEKINRRETAYFTKIYYHMQFQDPTLSGITVTGSKYERRGK
jgi:hypothetical protein